MNMKEQADILLRIKNYLTGAHNLNRLTSSEERIGLGLQVIENRLDYLGRQEAQREAGPSEKVNTNAAPQIPDTARPGLGGVSPLNVSADAALVRDAMKHPHGIEAGIYWALEVQARRFALVQREAAVPSKCTLEIRQYLEGKTGVAFIEGWNSLFAKWAARPGKGRGE